MHPRKSSVMTARAGRMLRKIRNFTIPARSSLEFNFFIMRLPASIPVQAPGMMTAPKTSNFQLIKRTIVANYNNLY